MPVVYTEENGKTPSVLSYFTLIGWIIAYFAFHKNAPTALGTYHLRQTLLLHLIGILCGWVMRVVDTTMAFTLGVPLNLGWILNIFLFILWIVGFVGALQGRKKPIPLIGEAAQSLFRSI